MHSASQNALRRYSELEYILIGDLRELLEFADDPETRRWIISVTDALLETLPEEFALKEQDGYLREVLEVQPNWQSQVVRLQSEHETLIQRLVELRSQLVSNTSTTAPMALADQLAADLREWMRELVAHNRHETRLMQTAVNLEVGVGD